jgi:hypothetical protein
MSNPWVDFYRWFQYGDPVVRQYAREVETRGFIVYPECPECGCEGPMDRPCVRCGYGPEFKPWRKVFANGMREP